MYEEEEKMQQQSWLVSEILYNKKSNWLDSFMVSFEAFGTWSVEKKQKWWGCFLN